MGAAILEWGFLLLALGDILPVATKELASLDGVILGGEAISQLAAAVGHLLVVDMLGQIVALWPPLTWGILLLEMVW